MHDLLLAQQILNEIQRVAKKRRIGNIKSVSLEIGSVALSHGNLPEHIDEIDPGNIQFLLENMSANNGLDKAVFNIKKIPGDRWKILDIEAL